MTTPVILLTSLPQRPRVHPALGWFVAAFALCSGLYFAHRALPLDHYAGFDDFGTVYGAARCWIHGQNPYPDANVSAAFHAAGGPADVPSGTKLRPSVYFMPALPLFALISWLPWYPAGLVWYVLSITCFLASTLIICSRLPLPIAGQIVAASLALIFCKPFLIGLRFGNPSVVVIGALIIAAVFAVFLVRRLWMPLFAGTAAFCLIALAGVVRAGSPSVLMQWLTAQSQNVAMTLGPGNVNDASLGSPFGRELLNIQALLAVFLPRATITNVLALLFCAALTLTYLSLRKTGVRSDPSGINLWADLGFFSLVLLAGFYHRNYDAGTLIVLLPWVATVFRRGHRWIAVASGVCLLLLFASSSFDLIPLLGADGTKGPLSIALLLRYQAFLVAALGLMLAFSRNGLAPRDSNEFDLSHGLDHHF
jgi:hypothetical protein